VKTVSRANSRPADFFCTCSDVRCILIASFVRSIRIQPIGRLAMLPRRVKRGGVHGAGERIKKCLRRAAGLVLGRRVRRKSRAAWMIWADALPRVFFLPIV
jgi:hypothetical protein